MKNFLFKKRGKMENGINLRKKLISHKKLAQERTILANERNTLAYIRTWFSAFVLGIAAIKLFENDGFFLYAGWIAVLIGVLFVTLGIVYYPIRKRKIKSY